MHGETLVQECREKEPLRSRKGAGTSASSKWSTATPSAHRRWLAISFPWWSTDLARGRLHAGGAGNGASEKEAARILVVREHRGAKQVVAACPASRAAGVRSGMKLAEARAVSGVESIEVAWDPIAERRSLRRLASWCTRYAPRVMPVPGILGAARGGASAHGAAPRDDAEFNRMIGRRGTEPAILVDITGCELVHCGDASLAARVLRDLHRRGIHAQVAIASTQRAALAASIAWPCRVVPADRAESLELLSPLPLWTLRLSADLVDSLREINVTRIGHALMLPRGGAADRFGPELRHALDAMRGECVEDFHPLPHAAPIECELAFDGATTQPEAIELAVVQLLDRFCLRLARRQRGVRLLELSLDRIDALPIVERLTLGRPSRRAKHLWTLLRPRLERVNLGYGVEGVRLRSLLDAPLSLEQGRWSAADAGRAGAEHGEDDRAVAEMIDQFRSRLGHESISRFGYESISRLEHGAAWKSSDDSRAIEPYRPTVVFSKALSAEVTAEHLGTPDAAPRAMRPMAVRWAGGGGRVLECDGPERHAPRWWMDASGHRGGNGNGNGNRDRAGSGGVDRGESGGVDRGESGGVDRGGVGGEEDDRWRVRTDDGRWLWLLHHGGERWSVIGVWA